MERSPEAKSCQVAGAPIWDHLQWTYAHMHCVGTFVITANWEKMFVSRWKSPFMWTTVLILRESSLLVAHGPFVAVQLLNCECHFRRGGQSPGGLLCNLLDTGGFNQWQWASNSSTSAKSTSSDLWINHGRPGSYESTLITLHWHCPTKMLQAPPHVQVFCDTS